MSTSPAWRRLVDHVMAVPERIYEHWNTTDGWDNHTQWGVEYGEDGVPYCVIGAWDMYHECGLDKAVPKVDNVIVFSNWAHTNGEWSEFPSIGAWTNFGNGHCEIVVGFDDTNVITKGWNSVQAGAADAGQGNGVWEHTNPRRSNRVVGYLAPRFPDGVCPPTADPQDPRGGTAVTSWRWSAPVAPTPPPAKPTCPPFPGRQYFTLGATGDYAKQLQTWLAKGNWGPAYKVGPSRTMTQLDLDKVKALQQHYLADLGPADGLTGPKTWLYAWQVANGLRKK